MEDFEELDKPRRAALVRFVAGLYREGTCVRCAVRFLCAHSVPLFNHSETELVALFHALPDSSEDTQMKPFPRPFSTCTLCLGILQDTENTHQPLYREQVQSALAASGHRYKSFQFCVTLPFVSIVREMAVLAQFDQALG